MISLPTPPINYSMFQITCTPKHFAFNGGGDLWAFDYDFEGESIIDEPLMPEATELMNRLLQHKYPEPTAKIQVTFSSFDVVKDADIELKYVGPKDEGSLYEVVNPPKPELAMSIWLCPVFDSFYQERPEQLFVSVERLD
jgi:hypothetical protein